MSTDNILSSESWKTAQCFLSISKKLSQLQHYKNNRASPEVLQLVELESKAFGMECEKLFTEIFGLGKRTSSQNDATYKERKIEIKCARFWAGKDDCKWQHLEPDHDYEYALFGLLDFHGFQLWIIKKSDLMGEMRDKKILTFQGKQGWWTTKSMILPYLTPIRSVADLDAFIE